MYVNLKRLSELLIMEVEQFHPGSGFFLNVELSF